MRCGLEKTGLRCYDHRVAGSVVRVVHVALAVVYVVGVARLACAADDSGVVLAFGVVFVVSSAVFARVASVAASVAALV